MNGEGQDFAQILPPSIILSGHFNRARHATHEGRWPHGSLDLDIPANVGEIEQAIAKFDARNFVADKDGPATQLIKVQTLSPASYTEQQGKGRTTANQVNPVTDRESLIRPTAVTA